MNAMGVKAGDDGFAVMGGAAEVTKFGYSDKTEDFIGGQGAVAGATIHDPVNSPISRRREHAGETSVRAGRVRVSFAGMFQRRE